MNAARSYPPLTDTEVFWLTLWCWRYTLESDGFDKRQARRIAHLRLLYRHSPAEVC